MTAFFIYCVNKNKIALDLAVIGEAYHVAKCLPSRGTLANFRSVTLNPAIDGSVLNLASTTS
ncbi:MAG: hypothetical protein AAF329_29120, partial [Cyanobacteria bacterium P01_A01_bin.17]